MVEKKITEYNRKYQQRRRSLNAVIEHDFRCVSGIDDVGQVDSVLREMAQIELAIENEKKQFNERVEKLNLYLQETIESWHGQQKCLELLLVKFIEKHFKAENKKSENFDFGTISKTKAGIKIKLNLDAALKRLGKP